MIVWISGTFGVGKTTTAETLSETTGWRLFDPEHVGYLLAGSLRDVDFDDFQDLPPWRALVPEVVEQIYRFVDPAAMIAVQTVLVEAYWADLMNGFSDRGLPVFHVVLDCDDDELRRRIDGDEVESQAREWRLDHLERYAAARTWLTATADLVVDTTRLAPGAIADRIIGAADLHRPDTVG